MDGGVARGVDMDVSASSLETGSRGLHETPAATTASRPRSFHAFEKKPVGETRSQLFVF